MHRFPLCLALVLCVASHAQEVSLSGQVVDAGGAPVDGVWVRLLGSDLTTLTGSDGRWAIDEGNARAIFPNRVVSASRIAWDGPGSDMQITVATKTSITVLMFSADGSQVGKQHLECTGTSTNRLSVPASATLVGVATQACDRVAYALSGGRATLTFSTCPGATPVAATAPGVKDIISFELPGYLPARVPLDTLVRSDALAKPVRLTASGNTVTADPGTLASVAKRCKGGEIVMLSDGNYGVFEQSGPTGYEWWVTFRAAPGAKPVFEQINMSQATKSSDGENDMWTCFDGVQITNNVNVRGARWVDVRNCAITSAGDLNGSMENIQKSAVSIRDSRGIRIEGCDISHTGIGINGRGNHLIYRRNHIHHCSQDGIHFLGGHDWLCEYNDAHDFEDGATDEEQKSGSKKWNMHCDCLQMYPIYGNDEPTNWLADCTMRGNRFYRPEGMGWMIQSKTQNQLKRFLFENNITQAVPGYMFHFKDSCDGVVFRFNSFVIPEAGYQYKGIFNRDFNTKGGNNMVALPSSSWASKTIFIEVYGNIMGGKNEFGGAKVTRCDNNIYYGGGGGGNGPGERTVGQPPFVDLASVEAIPAGPAVSANLILPDQPGERHKVPLPAYDANGYPRASVTCIGAVDINARPPQRTKPGKGKETTQKDTASSAQAPSAAPAGPLLAIEKSVRAAWDGRLQAAIRRTLAGSIPPGFTSKLTGGQAEIESLGDGTELVVRFAGTGSMAVDWARFVPSELTGIARTVSADPEEKHQLCAFYLLLDDKRDEAEKELNQAGLGRDIIRKLFYPAEPAAQ